MGARGAARIENFRIRENNNVGTDFIDGPDIVLSAEAVPAPEMVRYMGKPMTSGTLYNESSLPLGPFEVVKPYGGNENERIGQITSGR